jgi:cytosine/adenosine deaminase-related metal-dependent hydrolase
VLRLFRASWILPIAGPPIRDGWVMTWAGRVIACGNAPSNPAAPNPDIDIVELGTAAVLPGLVNAHTHLELSWMRGQVPPASSMPAWAARLMALRRTVGTEPAQPIVNAIRDARASGTALVGDVTNTFGSYEPLADSDLAAAIFREVLGFNVADPERIVGDAQRQIDALSPIEWLRISIVPHAPYSVSPALLRAIAAAAGDRPISVHLGESSEERRFLRDGTGAWRELLEELRVWNPEWKPPQCGPVEYLYRAGLLNERLVAVHCVQLDDGELGWLRDAGATVVACPRSNRWTGAGTPPLERFYASGVRVAVGTDSLASVDDLNMFAELAAMRSLAPGVAAARLLESATRNGAAALGFGDDLGTIEPGRRAELMAVRLPPGVVDVEEYLVSGVGPSDIRWLETT